MSAERDLILSAADLITEPEGTRVASSNPEYDRALVEVVGRTIGADTGDLAVRDTIYLMLRELRQ